MKTILESFKESSTNSIQFEIEMLQDFYAKEQLSKEKEKEETHFLVVDDNYDLVSYIQDCLTTDFKNITVIAVGSGEIALKEISQKIPDVLITDITMPGMDGFALITEFQKRETEAKIKLLVITGKELSSEELLQLKELNISGILYKPFDSERLVETVKNLLNNSTEHQK